VGGAEGVRPLRPFFGLAYATLTSMDLGFGFSALGRWTQSMPSLNSAWTLSSATSPGSEKVRTKVP